MAIETFGDGGFIVTGEHIPLARAITMVHALTMEITSPLKVGRGSLMLAANGIVGALDTAAVREATGVRVPTLGLKRTKRGALVDLVEYLGIVWGYVPTDRVAGAMGATDAGKVARRVAKVRAVVEAQTVQGTGK